MSQLRNVSFFVCATLFSTGKLLGEIPWGNWQNLPWVFYVISYFLSETVTPLTTPPTMTEAPTSPHSGQPRTLEFTQFFTVSGGYKMASSD